MSIFKKAKAVKPIGLDVIERLVEKVLKEKLNENLLDGFWTLNRLDQYLGSEAFIDKVVAKINRKQLKGR